MTYLKCCQTAAEGEYPLKKAIDALTTYFMPNVAYEEYQFRQAIQDQGETIMAYYTKLKRLPAEHATSQTRIEKLNLKLHTTVLRRS